MINKIFFSIIIIITIISCENTYTPKPKAFFRINFPEKEYTEFAAKNKFKITIPKYANLDTNRADSGWYVLQIPKLNASIYITYRTNIDIKKEIEESRSLVYKHAIKADDIIESTFINYPNKVFASIYDINGNTASSINFHIIDSTSTFFRGALYFNSKPNKDSLAPVIKFVRTDIIKLMETFKWDKK
jgi:gliding motility-associated lipoprotein GldD